MRLDLYFVRLAAVCAGIVAVAGCGNGVPQAQLSSSSAEQVLTTTHGDAGQSWMTPNAKRGPLLYISTWDTEAVYVYTYPNNKLVGKLAGFTQPAGLCSDSKGNVFVTNYNGARITEFAHGGTRPIATLNDPGTHPSGCSVDPTTGNLAVAGILNSVNGPSQPGAVAIFSKATGSPTLYPVAYATTEFCGYDNKGNLFVDGMGWGEQPSFVLSELRKGQTSAETISLDHAPGAPGAVQWYGHNLSVGDTYGEVYQYAIKGGSGTQVGSVVVNPRMGQFWIHRSRLIVTKYLWGSDWPVQIYAYPSGDGPIATITGLQSQYGVTVSVPPSN